MILIRTLAIVVAAVAGYTAFIAVLDRAAATLPLRVQDRARVLIFVGPAIALLAIGLVLPAIRTFVLSFLDDSTSTKSVGFANYSEIFTTEGGRHILRNNAYWVLIVPTMSVIVGVCVATLADKYRGESIAKALIFLPNAISLAGAGIVWKFVYAYRAPDQPQIGVLNKLLTSVGFGPHRFIVDRPPNWAWIPGLNSLFLMFVMIWVQAGFATVVLSAAIKGVPTEYLEASRIDGATERQVFWKILMPSIKPTIIVVWTTTTIAVLKAYDVVKAMTGGNFDTDVVASAMMRQTFSSSRPGYGAALAVILFVAVIPVMYFNIRNYQAEKAGR